MAVVEQFGADGFFGTATEEHAMRQDARHHAFRFQEVKTVQQEGEVGGGLGGGEGRGFLSARSRLLCGKRQHAAAVQVLCRIR